MKLGPRGKLLLIVLIFAAPIVASYLAYFYAHPKPTANHFFIPMPQL